SGKNFYFVLLVLAAAIAGCSGMETPVLTVEPPPAPTQDIESPDFPLEEWAARLSPHDILVQRDFLPGLLRPEMHYPFGRAAPFTLFSDGTLIYLDEGAGFDDQRLMWVQLPVEEARAILEEVWDAGFDRLESHPDECQSQPDGSSVCVMDAGTAILRARTPEGDLREVQIYHEYANDPDAFSSILDFLDRYQHPGSSLYQPDQATLFLSLAGPTAGPSMGEWPLRPELLRLPIGELGYRAGVLEGPELREFLSHIPRNMGEQRFEYDGRLYSAFLVPWLPGADHRQAIAEAFPAPENSAPGPTPTGRATSAECPIERISPEDFFRLAYVQDGDLWLLDAGKEAARLTDSGDLHSVKLSPDGSRVVFTRQLDATRQELWAVEVDERLPYRLAGGPDLAGAIEIIEFSDAHPLVAFSRQVDPQQAELWVADTNGSGASLLADQQDLMAEIQEPSADSATLAGVTWIPGTSALVYDAFPQFDEEGIYIYVQRQNWQVDALSGEHSVLFPPGEGGMLSYSPDGRALAVVTPESLDLVNLETGERQEAGLDYFALGMGEYYFFPPLEWAPDSRSLYLIQPEKEGFEQDMEIGVWQVPVDGGPAELLSQVKGFGPSVSLSPDLSRVAYWKAEAGSNYRELHIAALDGSEDIRYAAGDLMEFQGWTPDSGFFVYRLWQPEDSQPMLGGLCSPAAALTPPGVVAAPDWIDEVHFLYIIENDGLLELHLGTPGGLGGLPLTRGREFPVYSSVVLESP
ncbi:MAG: hypothetical protein R3335_13485, partial [Anaerolineales bacterium]|nr:hypothetical protein [Anaerolineales bacterium]